MNKTNNEKEVTQSSLLFSSVGSQSTTPYVAKSGIQVEQMLSSHTSKSTGKIMQDPLYGSITVESFIVDIIDTRYFQRLRNLKQDGNSNQVYPSSTHTRFEHSIGVYHLTNQLLKNLNDEVMKTFKNNQEKQDYDKATKLVKVAAICHDIGHGPFSHLFEDVLKEINKQQKFNHEIIGGFIIDKMLAELNYSQDDISIIKLLIQGDYIVSDIFEKYMFLCGIVSNSQSSLDTDKLDYLNRDAHAVKLPINVNAERILQNCHIFEINNQYYTCYQTNVQLEIGQVYSARYSLHRIIYQHAKVLAADINTKNILVEANKLKLIDFHQSIELLQSQQQNWFDLYELYDDNIINLIIFQIRIQRLNEQSQYQNLIQMISYCKEHQLYPSLYRCFIRSKQLKLTQHQLIDQLQKECEQLNVIICVRNIHYGQNEVNPIDYIAFQQKNKVFLTKKLNLYLIQSQQISISTLDQQYQQQPQQDDPMMSIVDDMQNQKNSLNQTIYIRQQSLQSLTQPLVYKEFGVYIFYNKMRKDIDYENELKDKAKQVKKIMKQIMQNNMQKLEIIKQPCYDEFEQYLLE